VPDGREQGHVESALGDQDLRGVCLDAGDRAQQLDDLGMLDERELDALGEALERGVERVDVREQLGDHHPVVLELEAALERLAQLRDLQAHPGLGELGELLGIADARQERFEHRPRGLRVGRRRDRESLIPASWSTFSSRWIVRARSLACALRRRVRSRSRRISGGGTKLGLTRPCCTSWQIHSESLTSVLRPGTLRKCCALSTSTRTDPPAPGTRSSSTRRSLPSRRA
jgi:hypothetical protein